MTTNYLTPRDEVWESQSSWYRRDYDAEAVAAYLDESGDTLVAGFFSGYSSPHSQRWSLADIYNYIANQHQERTDARIPRLFPLTQPYRPARLLFTQLIENRSDGIEVVVHAWNPHDDRGLIAIAYPVRDCPQAMTTEAAATLLGILTWASAVAVPSGHDVQRPLDSLVQPGVWVADGRVARHRDGVGVATEHCRWGDLANLLRIDLPWWSASLRDRDAMLIWRPDDPCSEITPATCDRDPGALQTILTSDSSPVLRRIINKATRWIEYQLVSNYRETWGHDHYSEFAGLTQAAKTSISGPPPPLTAGEAALVLHQRIDDPVAAQQTALTLGRQPVAHDIYIIDASMAQQPLVQAWLNRLIPAAHPDELGFQLPAQYLSMAEGPVEYLMHPLWPDCWIIRAGTTTAVTIGTSVPASGQLTQVYVTGHEGFFRDSTGAVWPMPLPYTSYEGTIRVLARVLTQLRADAGTELDEETESLDPLPELITWLENNRLPVEFVCEPRSAPAP